MKELIIGETYKMNMTYSTGVSGEYRIIAKSPVTGNFIGEPVNGGVLRKFTNDGRRIDIYGNINSDQQLIPIPKEIEVEYEFWINFYKDGAGIKHGSFESASKSTSLGYLETKKFTHKAKYTE